MYAVPQASITRCTRTMFGWSNRAHPRLFPKTRQAPSVALRTGPRPGTDATVRLGLDVGAGGGGSGPGGGLRLDAGGGRSSTSAGRLPDPPGDAADEAGVPGAKNLLPTKLVQPALRLGISLPGGQAVPPDGFLEIPLHSPT